MICLVQVTGSITVPGPEITGLCISPDQRHQMGMLGMPKTFLRTDFFYLVLTDPIKYSSKLPRCPVDLRYMNHVAIFILSSFANFRYLVVAERSTTTLYRTPLSWICAGVEFRVSLLAGVSLRERMAELPRVKWISRKSWHIFAMYTELNWHEIWIFH